MPVVNLDEEVLLNAQVLYREWGKFLTAHQQYEKAVQYFNKSMEYGDENRLWTLVGLCEALQKSGHFRKAARAAKECIEIGVFSATSLLNLSTVFVTKTQKKKKKNYL